MNLKPIEELLRRTYEEAEYPALKEQMTRWAKERPLAGMHVLDATPVYRNTLLKYLALMAAGAQLTVGTSRVMAHDPGIIRLLEECGVPVCDAENCGQGATFDLILDCAGSFSRLIPRIGYVELTHSGMDSFQNNQRPVFFADGGKIKRIETCLGTGESYFRAMQQLGYNDWDGRKLILFGCGKVGSGILFQAHSRGVKTTVVSDLSCLRPEVRGYAAEIIDWHDLPRITAALQGAYAVVTATGVRNALSAIPAGILTGCGALLANMGVEDEFGPHVAPESVLNNKQTLNFILEEPTRLRYIDATMALHNAGAVYLMEQHFPPSYRFLLPPEAIETGILSVTRQKGLLGKELAYIS
ncbi:MAG: hypothetical protein ACOYJE_06320 [Bacteroidaceae bacterium]|jgi:adenosylhomocysteinase